MTGSKPESALIPLTRTRDACIKKPLGHCSARPS